MTRKKWSKLRRNRPELFWRMPPYESWNQFEQQQMKAVSSSMAIGALTAWLMEQPDGGLRYRLEPLIDYGLDV